jgi:hypothetical protein
MHFWDLSLRPMIGWGVSPLCTGDPSPQILFIPPFAKNAKDGPPDLCRLGREKDGSFIGLPKLVT